MISDNFNGIWNPQDFVRTWVPGDFGLRWSWRNLGVRSNHDPVRLLDPYVPDQISDPNTHDRTMDFGTSDLKTQDPPDQSDLEPMYSRSEFRSKQLRPDFQTLPDGVRTPKLRTLDPDILFSTSNSGTSDGSWSQITLPGPGTQTTLHTSQTSQPYVTNRTVIRLDHGYRHSRSDSGLRSIPLDHDHVRTSDSDVPDWTEIRPDLWPFRISDLGVSNRTRNPLGS